MHWTFLRFWNCMGEIMEPMTQDKLPVFFKELLQPCIPSEAAGLLVAAVLRCSASKEGNVIARDLWWKSGLQWTDFLGVDWNVEKFIQDQKLEFLGAPRNVEAQMTSPNVVEKPMSSLRSMLSQKSMPTQRSMLPQKSMSSQRSIEEVKQSLLNLLIFVRNEMIYKYIDMSPQLYKTSESTFIRALVLAVNEKAISGAKYESTHLKTHLNQRIPLLKLYIGQDEHLQLQALYALQSLVKQLGHPSGLLGHIFQILHDADVIKKETFRTWELSMDPKEWDGKTAAVTTVAAFLKGLEQESQRQKQDKESSCCVS